MTFLPIVERELRVAARRRGTYGMRVRIAGAATLAFAVCYVVCQISPAVPFGKTLFTGLAALCLLYCLAAGRMMTADCLSGEKRDGTLGLLFLTDLKGYDVVLGKLAATSFNGFYGLLAVFPMLALPILTGGMTNGELWRTALVLVNTFLFSLSIGLFVSALCRDEQKVMAANFLLLLLLMAVPPACGAFLSRPWEPRPRPVNFDWFSSCPVYSFSLCFDALYNKSSAQFWRSLGFTFHLTLTLVLLACRIAPRAWQDKPLTPRALKRKGERGRRWWREGRVEQAYAFRRKLLGVNAYFWLAARPYLKVSYVWTCVLSLGLWWIFITMMVGHKDETVDYFIAFLLNGMLKLWIANEAGHQLAADKKSGAYELLLSTPLTVADIVRGQWLALRRQFLKPLALTIALEIVLMVSVRYIHGQDVVQARYVWLAGILMLVADVFTVAWFAMSAALTEKSHDRATLKAAACVLGLPWLLFALVYPLTQLWNFLVHRWEPDWPYYLVWWFGLGIGLDALFLLSTKRKVQTYFRQLALDALAPSERFVPLKSPAKASLEPKPPARLKLRWLAVAGVLVLAAALCVTMYIQRVTRFNLPKPVIVSLSQSNQPVRVYGGQCGFLFIMPDGTLWQWVHPLGAQSGIYQPKQVGTNADWLQVSVKTPSSAAGVRADGTLWEWAVLPQDPKQMGNDHDWVETRAGSDFLLARKRDGTLWGCGNAEKLGNDLPPDSSSSNRPGRGTVRTVKDLVQIGTHHDWKAICTSSGAASVLALRTDGTLWIWGNFTFQASGIWSQTNYPTPVRVCSESNWVGLDEGLWSASINQAGERWRLFPCTGQPGPDVSIDQLGHLDSTNGTVAFGPVFHSSWNSARYETRSDGTLWVAPFSWPNIPPPSSGFPLDKGSNWVSIWGNFSTTIGLTADGTIWTWGTDFGQQRHQDFGERLDMVRNAVSNTFGSTPRSAMYDDWQGYQPQKEPRPLLRLVFTNRQELRK